VAGFFASLRTVNELRAGANQNIAYPQDRKYAPIPFSAVLHWAEQLRIHSHHARQHTRVHPITFTAAGMY